MKDEALALSRRAGAGDLAAAKRLVQLLEERTGTHPSMFALISRRIREDMAKRLAEFPPSLLEEARRERERGDQPPRPRSQDVHGFVIRPPDDPATDEIRTALMLAGEKVLNGIASGWSEDRQSDSLFHFFNDELNDAVGEVLKAAGL